MQIDREKFFDAYRDWVGALHQAQVDGLEDLLEFIEADSTCEYIPYVAYVLATAYHETAHTFLPIAEYGKGRGRPYGVPDPATGKTYYGRGYVQLTWKKNYQTFGTLLDLPLVKQPDLAMQPATAYKIMSIGMNKGLFTGRALFDYVNTTKKDYVGARRVINGVDRSVQVAEYAKKFEEILNNSKASSIIVLNTPEPIAVSEPAPNAWTGLFSGLIGWLTKK